MGGAPNGESSDLEIGLRASQEYNRGVIEATPTPLAVVNRDLIITDVNESLVQSTGYTRRELLGQPFARYFDVPWGSAPWIEQVFVSGSASAVDLVLRSKAGFFRAVRCDAATFRGPEGSLLAVIATVFR